MTVFTIKTLVMKKLVILILAVLATTTATFALSLREAFDALSNLPNIGIKAPDYNLPVIGNIIESGEIAAAYNLDAEQIKVSGNGAFAILNQVPLSYMINGGCNNEVAALVYATPDNKGTNDILIAVMSGYKGSVVFLYGTISNAEKEAIQSAPLRMQGNYISIETVMPDGSDFNISIGKGR